MIYFPWRKNFQNFIFHLWKFLQFFLLDSKYHHAFSLEGELIIISTLRGEIEKNVKIDTFFINFGNFFPAGEKTYSYFPTAGTRRGKISMIFFPPRENCYSEYPFTAPLVISWTASASANKFAACLSGCKPWNWSNIHGYTISPVNRNGLPVL